MYLLPRAIDGTIGINLIFSLIILLLIIAGTAKIDVPGWRKLVIVGRNQHHSIHIFEVSLSVLICCQAGMNYSLVLLRLEIIPLVVEFYLRPGDRLSVGSIHHHIAMLIIRQLLDHHRQIADIEEFALRSDAGIIRSYLHQIGTQRQIATDFNGILHLLIIRTTIVIPAVILLMQFRGLLQEHLIGSLILSIIFIIRRDVEAGDADFQVLEITHIQLHPNLLPRSQYLRHILHPEHRFGKSLLRISQFVHSRPFTPAAQRIVDIVELILRFGIGSTFHEAEMLHGKFACLRNILINLDERVDGLQILRFLHLSHVVLAVFLDELIGTETSRTPIAHLIIIGVQLQIRLLAISLETDEMQQIVVKGTAIHPLQRQWYILGRSMLGKKLWVRHRFLEELLALLQVYLSLTLIIRSILPLFQRSLIHFYSIQIIMIHLAEHSISHHFQHRVICLQSFSLHPLHIRRQ